MRGGKVFQTSAALAIGSGIIAAAAALSWPRASAQAPAKESNKPDPKINDAFKKPDVKAYIKKFESNDREAYLRRHEIVAALGLSPGMIVADIGAGTGLFTRLMAEKVGAAGKVYAVDIAPEFLAHIAADAKKQGRKQIVTVRGDQDSTNLPRGALDLIFLSDVYHHLERPAKVLASLRDSLKPGGKLVVVEFDRVEGRSSEFVLKHVRAGRDVFIKEIESAGFARVKSTKGPVLKENFFAAFQKLPLGERPEDETKPRAR
jgi:ubiquinone/menaquinone biosynthesis C-methylase UbiE